MDKIRTKFGKDGYVAMYERVKIHYEDASDNEDKYFWNMELKVLELQIKIEEFNRSEEINKLLNNTTEENDLKSNEEINKKERDIKIDTGADSYYVDNNQRHRIFHAAINYCLATNTSILSLHAKDHRNIAKIINTSESTVRKELHILLGDSIQSLTNNDKQYYIVYLHELNVKDPFVLFPILKLDSEKTKISA